MTTGIKLNAPSNWQPMTSSASTASDVVDNLDGTYTATLTTPDASTNEASVISVTAQTAQQATSVATRAMSQLNQSGSLTLPTSEPPGVTSMMAEAGTKTDASGLTYGLATAAGETFSASSGLVTASATGRSSVSDTRSTRPLAAALLGASNQVAGGMVNQVAERAQAQQYAASNAPSSIYTSSNGATSSNTASTYPITAQQLMGYANAAGAAGNTIAEATFNSMAQAAQANGGTLSPSSSQLAPSFGGAFQAQPTGTDSYSASTDTGSGNAPLQAALARAIPANSPVANAGLATSAVNALASGDWPSATSSLTAMFGASTAANVVKDFQNPQNAAQINSDLAGILNAGGDTNQWNDAYTLSPLIQQQNAAQNGNAVATSTQSGASTQTVTNGQTGSGQLSSSEQTVTTEGAMAYAASSASAGDTTMATFWGYMAQAAQAHGGTVQVSANAIQATADGASNVKENIQAVLNQALPSDSPNSSASIANSAIAALSRRDWGSATSSLTAMFGASTAANVVKDFQNPQNAAQINSDLAGILNAGGDTNQWNNAYALSPLIQQQYAAQNGNAVATSTQSS